MNRRYFLRNTGLLAGAGLLFRQQALASLFRTAPNAIRMLRRNVGLFTQRGGTIGFLLSPEGIIVIDSQFPDTAEQFKTEVKQQRDAPFRFLLNTHHHGDHTGGNIAFKGIVEHVIAQENALGHLKRVSESQNALDKQLLPDQPFRDEMKLKLGNEKIKGYYFGAGHT
ncbi:MAG TPA: MBL fold metallo-hydrolase, partial [Chitinophagaceae bacterium]|nr:MBL fold metallo-hydrolase [Chitinophagaceae bacterium]